MLSAVPMGRRETQGSELWHQTLWFTLQKVLTADTVALTEQTAGQTCYWSWPMMEGGAPHLLRLHPDKDSEGHRVDLEPTCTCMPHQFCHYPLSSKHQLVCTHRQTGSQTMERHCLLHTGAFSFSFLMLPECTMSTLVHWMNISLRDNCERWCAVISVKMLPEWFCEWKIEP